jgi:oligosaccharide repeat unit polymerase
MNMAPSSLSSRFLQTGIGALLMLLGIAAAALSVPRDFSQRGDLVLTGMILVGALMVPTATSWRNDIRAILRGENLLIAALVYWTLLDILQGAFALPVSREAIVREIWLLGITALGFWVGASIAKPWAPRFLVEEALQPWSVATIFRLLVIAFALGVWDFLYRANFDLDVVLQSLTVSRWAAPWQRDALGDWSAFSYHLQYFGYLVPPMAVLLVLRAGWRNPGTWIAIAMSTIILFFHAQGGGRRIVGAMILAALFCWLISARRLDARRIVVLGAAVACLAAAMQVMLIYRSIGFGDEGSEIGSFDYLFIDDNFLRIAQMLEFVPESYPFVGWQYVLFAIVRPVPRVLWPDKPIDGGFDLAEVLGVPDTSFALTVAGELYVSYGFLAAFIGGCVYGRLASTVNALFALDMRRLNPLFPALLLVWLFVGVRSMLEIMLMGYVILFVILLGKFGRFLESVGARAAALRRRSPQGP